MIESSDSRVLLVDDDPAFSSMVADFLERSGADFHISTVSNATAALDHLDAEAVDCIVSDYDMPGMDGLGLLEAVRVAEPDLPFILFTGKGSEEIASLAISSGVTDYLQKGSGLEQYDLLANRIENAISRYRSEAELRLFRQAVEHAGHSIFWTDREGTIEYVNPAFERITGYARADAIGETPRILQSGVHDEAFYEQLWETILAGDVWKREVVNERKSGEQYRVEQTIAPITDENGSITRFVAINTELPSDPLTVAAE